VQRFIEANWLTLISILIGVLVAFFFYRLQKKDAVSAGAERKKHANRELLDVVESYIINKQELSEQVVENLIHASERDHQVLLRESCTPISLLQDVALRLQRSRHLDIPQKSEYSQKIDSLITQIRESKEVPSLDRLDKELRDGLSLLQSMVPEGKEAEAKKALDAIARVSEKRTEMSATKTQTDSLFEWSAPIIAGIAATLGATTLGSELLSDEVLGLSPSLSFSTSFLVLSALLLIAMVVSVFPILARIRRRERESKEGRSTEA
jgi:hypothetical protein